MKTLKEIKNMVANNDVVELHTSYARGYVSRKATESTITAVEYNGRFGKGYKVYTPCFESTKYCYVTYYVA